MKNLLVLIICLFPFSMFSQVHILSSLDSSVILENNNISNKILKNVNNEKKLDWFNILRTNFSQTEKSGMDTVLLDSVYVFQFQSLNDSSLIQKKHFIYDSAGERVIVNNFEFDSLSQFWFHNSIEKHYYDINRNDSLKTEDRRDNLSNTWIPYRKMEYNLDRNGNELLNAYYLWNDSLQLWKGLSKDEKVLDENENLISYSFFEWDNDSNIWYVYSRREYSYDSRGNKTLDVYFNTDWQTNEFTPKNKYEYEFDENGNKTMDASYSWNKEKEQWRGDSKFESVYDENEILSFYYTWDNKNDKWKNEQKTMHNFYENRKSTVVFFWNDELYAWYGNWYQEDEFNQHGQDSIKIEYEWSFDDTVWYKKSKTEYSYNKPELFPSKITYKWNKQLEDWELDTKIELSFDDSDQLILEANYLWNDTLNEWEGITKTELKWNNNGDRTKTIHYDLVKSSLTEHNIQIFSFENDSLINKMSNEFCSGQTIAIQDTDYVEGTGSILWEYQVGELEKWEDGCKIGIKNGKDLSNGESFYFDFKIISPTNANLVVLFKETSGELWLFEDIELLANTSQLWKSPSFPFNDSELIANEDEENGILDLNKIDSVQFLIYDLKEKNISGALLLDNLGAYGYKDTSFWKVNSISENIYDNHNNLIFAKGYNLDYNSDTLRLNSQKKYEISYDAMGNKISFAEFQWISYSDTWFGLSRFEKTYDDSNRVISDASYYWNYEKEKWYGDRKTETTYDTNGNKTSKAYIYWDKTTNSWIPNQKNEYHFNSDNERTKYVFYKWNKSSEKWQLEYINYNTKYNYILDDNNNLILYESVQWDENLMIWRAVEKNYFYYSTHQVNATTTQPYLSQMENIRVYPNPFSNKLILEINAKKMELVIFDISGKKIITTQLHNLRNEINLFDIKRGLYVLQLYNGEKIVYNQKLIKQ